MALSYLALILLAVLGLVIVGGIVALCYRRTRWLGIVLLTAPLVLMCLLAAFFFVSIPVYRSHTSAEMNARTQTQIQASPLEFKITKHYENSKATPVPAKPAKPAKPAAPKTIVDKTHTILAEKSRALPKTKAEMPPKKSGRVVEALSMALGQALLDLSGPKDKAAADTVAHDAADKKTAEEKAANKKTTADKEKIVDKENADQVGKMVEVLSSALQEELPADVKVDQFTALRALGKLLGRMIASEQQEAQAVAEGANATEAADDAQPASGLKEQKTSAVAASAQKAGAKNEKKPDWVDALPQRVGDGYQVVFSVGPYTTRLECEQEMNRQLARAVREYAVLYFGSPDGAKVTLPTSFLRDHVVKDQWEEIFQSSFGPTVLLHVRLVFDGKANAELKADYRRATIEERLWMAGGGLGAILLVLAGCFAVLKFDQATEGEYRGRMIFAVFFAVVMATSVLGTRFLISMQPVDVPAEVANVQEISTETKPIVSSSPNDVNSTDRVAETTTHRSTQVSSGVAYAKLSFLSLFALVLPACLLVVMLFFRKTRKIAVILLSLGVVLVVGGMFLVA